MAHRDHDNDPFYFSDSIRDIDEEAPFVRLQLFLSLKSPVALMCIDASSGEESIHAGYVTKTDDWVLQLETQDQRHVTVDLTNADFYPLEREDAPSQLKAITTGAYNAGMRFNTGKLKGYLLGVLG